MAESLDVALIIGVDDYRKFPGGLARCGGVQNAIRVDRWFRKSCEAIKTTPIVETLLSRVENTTTVDNIFEVAKEVCETHARPGSRLFFYFSGHGVCDMERRDVLLCEDSSLISSGI